MYFVIYNKTVINLKKYYNRHDRVFIGYKITKYLNVLEI